MPRALMTHKLPIRQRSWTPDWRSLKLFIRAFVSGPKRVSELCLNYVYDLSRFARHSSTFGLFRAEQQLRAWIDADVHKIEKGLALPQPRPGFGKGVAQRLVREMRMYQTSFGQHHSLAVAIEMLTLYIRFNRLHGISYQELEDEIRVLGESISEASGRAGCDEIRRDDWLSKSNIELEQFFASRRSVRDFAETPIDHKLLEQAVSMALHTPTVCNRQSLRAHAFTELNSVQAVLNCQSGNGGFGHSVPSVLVITADLRSFFNVAERNQCWIDGGLFAMSVVYALHSLGLGSCCLNWSVMRAQDRALRQCIKLEESEAVIMMIAVGHLKSNFKVAKSSRKPLADVLTFDNIRP